MGEGASGWLWLAIDVGLVALFGAFLYCGTTQRRRGRDEHKAAPEYKQSGER
jgi:hypothetical protein